MAGSRRRRRLQRQRAAAAARPQPTPNAQDPSASFVDLPPELVAEIQCRLDFVDRLNFFVGCGGAGVSSLRHKAEAPCLVLPGATTGTATLFSTAGREAGTAHAPDPAMRGHVVLGSTDGWLVTADAQGTLRMANPVTGEQAELPDIATGTIPFFDSWHGCHVLDMKLFTAVRFGGLPDGEWHAPLTLGKWQMRKWFYRKAVLSASPRPGRYSAMLILARHFGAPAFATADDPAWRLAPSPDGVEDAIHHDGRFYSITYTGVVEKWDRHAETGEFTSTPVAPRLPGGEDVLRGRRKYIAVAPDGRLMAVLKDSRKEAIEVEHYWPREQVATPVFEVRVLDGERRQWVEAPDMGDLALFVGVNTSVCVSAREHPGIRGGCVYYADDELGQASLRLERDGRFGYGPSYRSSIDSDRCNYELRDLGVYVLNDGTVERVEGLGRHPCWPPPAWFTPSV